MKKFINMSFNGSKWWVEYEEGGTYHINYYDTEADANNFYLSIIVN